MSYKSQKFDGTDQYFLSGRVDWKQDQIALAFFSCPTKNVSTKQYLGQIQSGSLYTKLFDLEKRSITERGMAMASDITVNARELKKPGILQSTRAPISGFVIFQKTTSVFTSRLLLMTCWTSLTLIPGDPSCDTICISWESKSGTDGIFPVAGKAMIKTD